MWVDTYQLMLDKVRVKGASKMWLLGSCRFGNDGGQLGYHGEWYGATAEYREAIEQ